MEIPSEDSGRSEGQSIEPVAGYYRATLTNRSGVPLAYAGPFATFAEARAAGDDLRGVVAAAGAAHRVFVEVLNVQRVIEVA